MKFILWLNNFFFRYLFFFSLFLFISIIIVSCVGFEFFDKNSEFLWVVVFFW